jgi:hypothetical protein
MCSTCAVVLVLVTALQVVQTAQPAHVALAGGAHSTGLLQCIHVCLLCPQCVQLVHSKCTHSRHLTRHFGLTTLVTPSTPPEAAWVHRLDECPVRALTPPHGSYSWPGLHAGGLSSACRPHAEPRFLASSVSKPTGGLVLRLQAALGWRACDLARNVLAA